MNIFFKPKQIKYNHRLEVGSIVQHKVNVKRMIVVGLIDEDWLTCSFFNDVAGHFEDQPFDYRELIK